MGQNSEWRKIVAFGWLRIAYLYHGDRVCWCKQVVQSHFPPRNTHAHPQPPDTIVGYAITARYHGTRTDGFDIRPRVFVTVVLSCLD